MRRVVVVCLISIGVIIGCVRTTPQSTSEPVNALPRIVVPEGCLELQDGTWLHGDDPSWRYVAQDDGGELSLVVHHRITIDAGFSPRKFRRVDAGVIDAGPAVLPANENENGDELPTARLELFRTDAGFVGATLARINIPTGRTCDVRFPTRVISCGDAGMVLETEESTALGDACQAPARPADSTLRRHHLIRPGDAG